MKLQLPSATVALHPPPRSSAIVTVPVGVPPLEVTLNVTVITSPTFEGSGVTLVMVVDVLPWLTVCSKPDDVEARSESPGAQGLEPEEVAEILLGGGIKRVSRECRH